MWLWPRIKDTFSLISSPKRLFTLTLVAIVVFFSGDILIRWAARRFFGWFGIPLEDFVSEPVAGAFLDFVFFFWYAIAFIPSALIWVAPESEGDALFITGDRAGKWASITICHLIWIGFSLSWLIALAIEGWL